MSVHKKMMEAAAGNAGAATYVDDLFSTYVYTGNGSTQTITNGIDLAGEGGMVWLKNRDNAYFHGLFDTERGATKRLATNATNAEATLSTSLTAFNSNGFSLGSEIIYNTANNASWTFRKAPKFFDVVTYTGDGIAGRTVAHNLGSVPGMIIVKSTDFTGGSDWLVYHQSLGNTKGLYLNKIDSEVTDSTFWNNTSPSSTDFSLGSNGRCNASGFTYVAYLFAHNNNDGEFGENADQDIIKCGSYTGNGSADGPEINLGFEPQWVMVKKSSSDAWAFNYWCIADMMRGMTNIDGDTGGLVLYPNVSDAENNLGFASAQPNGFKVRNNSSTVNASGETFIYIAIRRPHKPAETGSEVFEPAIENTTDDPRFDAPFAVDAAIQLYPTGGSGSYPRMHTRLTQGTYLVTSSTVAEAATTNSAFDYNDGYFLGTAVGTGVSHMFKRSPGFFDVVCYTGDGVAGRTVNHNLGVVPEMMIVKDRSDVTFWRVYHKDLTTNYSLVLNDSSAEGTGQNFWNSSTHSSTTFTLGDASNVNSATRPFIAYLFASQAGISKVGSYTGNGTSQTIDCGFTSGARFVLIKRTDSTGDWHVWDSTRGIVAGNDPYLELNTTNAEVTTADSIDPDSSGFVVNEEASAAINTNTATYIYLAIS